MVSRWHIETFKMTLCLSFPILCFYVFNKPEIFKEYLLRDKLANFPPKDKEGVRM